MILGRRPVFVLAGPSSTTCGLTDSRLRAPKCNKINARQNQGRNIVVGFSSQGSETTLEGYSWKEAGLCPCGPVRPVPIYRRHPMSLFHKASRCMRKTKGSAILDRIFSFLRSSRLNKCSLVNTASHALAPKGVSERAVTFSR